MIIIELFQDGNASIVSPSRIFQGTDTEKIVVLSPRPYNVPLEVALVKPDGTRTDYFPMNLVTNSQVQSEYVAKGVSVWEYLPTVSWTANFGQAFVSLLALLPAESNGQRHRTSFLASMVIEESALPELPSTPDADVYETILDYLANYGERIGKIETDLGTAQGDINDLENGLEQAQEDIEDIDGRVQTIERAYVSGVKGAAEAEYRHGNVNITKANIGLGNVDNTSDMEKPVSTPQQQAISQSFSDALSGAERYTDRHTFGLEYRYLSVITTNTNPTIEEVVQAMDNRSRFIGSVEGKGNLLPSTALGHGIEEITKIASDNATLRYQEYAEPYWSSLENTPFGSAQITRAVKAGDYIYAYSAVKQTFARFNTKSRSWSVEYDRLRKTTSTDLWFCAYNNVVHYMTYGANGLDALCALDFTTGTSSVVATITDGSIQGVYIGRVTDMVEDDRYIYFGGKDSLGYFFLYNKATQAFSLYGGTVGTGTEIKLTQDSDYVYYCTRFTLRKFSKTRLLVTQSYTIVEDDDTTSDIVFKPINWGDKVVIYVEDYDFNNFRGEVVNQLFFFDKASEEIVSAAMPSTTESGRQYIPLVAIDENNFYVYPRPVGVTQTQQVVFYGNGVDITTTFAVINWEDIGDPFSTQIIAGALSMIAYDGFVSLMGNSGYFSTYRNFQSAALWVGTYTADGWSGWYSVTGGNGGSGSGGSGNTTVYVGGEPQREINFSSDPQTQINNKSFNRVYKSILEAVPNADETLEMEDLISAMYDGSVLVASPKYTSQNNEELTFSNVIPSGASGVNGVVEIEKVDYNHVTARYTENSQWLVSGTINADERLIKSIQENGSIYQVFDDTTNSILLLRVFDEATKETRSITTSVSTSGIEFVNAVKIDNAVFVVGRVNTNAVTLVKIDISSEPITHTTYTPPIYSWTNSSSVHAIPMVHFPNDYRLYIFGGYSQLVYFNLNTSRFGMPVNIGVGQDGVSETGDISAVVGMYSVNVSSDSTKRFLIFADGFISVSYLDGELMDKQSNSDNYTCVSDEVVGLDNFGGTERWIFAISAKKNNTRSLYAISYFVDNSGNYSIGQDRARSFSSTSPIVADANTYMTRLLPEDESVDGSDSASTVNFYASDGNNLFKFKLSMQSEIIDKPNGLEISDVSIVSDGIFIQSTDTGYIEYLNLGSLSAFIGSLINGSFQWENVSLGSSEEPTPTPEINTDGLVEKPLYVGQKIQTIYFNTSETKAQMDAFLSRLTPDQATGMTGQNEISTIFVSDGATVHGVFSVDLTKFGGTGFAVAVCEASQSGFTILEPKYISEYSATNQTIINNFPGAESFIYSSAGWQGGNSYTLPQEVTIEYITPSDADETEKAGAYVGGSTYLWATVYELPSSGSNPNLLINSNFAINQRGANSYGGTANKYTVDRWKVLSNNVTVTPTSDGITFVNTVANAGILQLLDAELTQALINQKVTFSIKIKSTNTVRCSFRYGGGSGGSTGIGTALNISASNDYNTYSFTVTIPEITSGQFIRVIIEGINANTTAYLKWAKLEIGDVATAYTPPLIAEELQKCQRYFTKIDTSVSANKYQIYRFARSAYGMYDAQVFFPVRMRTRPTIALFSQNTDAEGYLYNVTQTTDQQFSVGYITTDGFQFGNTSGNMAANNVITGYYSADAEIY